MKNLFRIPALAALSLVLALPATALATPPAGTVLAGSITQSLNTANAYVGEPITLTGVTAPGAGISGATMYGTVTSVTRAGQGRAARLQLTMNRLVLSNGATYAVDGIVTGMQASTHTNALKEAAGAVGGMIVGNMIGKTIFHASGGGLLGAAGGFLIAKNNRQNMSVPAGSAVRVTLRSARRQARR